MKLFGRRKLFNNMLMLFSVFLLQAILYTLTTKDTLKYLKIQYKRGIEYFIGPNVNIFHRNHIMLEGKREFKIMFWTNSFRGSKWFGIGKEPFSQCPKYRNCVTTNKKEEYNSSDAVLMQMSFISVARESLPKYKFTDQKWVFFVLEAPANEESYSKYNGLFNLTWTYSRKSDFQSKYFDEVAVKRNHINKDVAYKNYAAGKTKLVAWFVSNCGLVPSSRWQYVMNLRRHIPVDIYGHCGPYKCERSKTKSCDKMLEQKYKFYLSFENSLCHDYVTEKFSRAINLNIVPVVLGAANYSEILPEKSYIDVKDFKTPKQLAEYLLKLHRNDSLYNNYLSWKGLYDLQKSTVIPAHCQICEYLNKYINQTNVYEDMEVSWSRNSVCYTPENFYPNVDKSSWQYNTLQSEYVKTCI